MANIGVVKFFKQVRQEAEKVTWSSRKDTIMSTIVVLVMILIMSVFFLIVDSVVFNIIQKILGL